MSGGCYLGVDGGGTKTAFVLIDERNHVTAEYQGGSSYYLQIGLDGLRAVLAEGIAAVCPDPAQIAHAFFGLPSYGEDSRIDPQLAALPKGILGHTRYTSGNDMVCGWAGSLGGADGINIVAGTGSIGYGERQGKSARAGGWGEVFSDEGSAYWIAVQGLNAFSRMSDRRLAKGPLHEIFADHFGLAHDLDICGKIMGDGAHRDAIAALSKLVAAAADAGDAIAADIFDRAAVALADIVDAIRRALGFEAGEVVRLSYSGGVFNSGVRMVAAFTQQTRLRCPAFQPITPIHPPSLGAALYAKSLARKIAK